MKAVATTTCVLALSVGVSIAVAARTNAVAAEKNDPRPVGAADAAAGKQLYLQECSGCHGERGNGAGPAAAFVDPRPRDFTSGLFKLRTTPAGEAPATSDVLRVIERGIPGTAMPAFKFLPEADRKRIAAYTLKLSDQLEQPEPQRIVASAPAANAQSIAKGKEVYVSAGCASCHGDLGMGDGPAAESLNDEAGNPIRPRNLVTEAFRGGDERVDIYNRLVTGMDGSPMPSYADAVKSADLWALADYVRSLRAAPVPQALPADAVAAGRQVAAKYNCQGCHVLDDGKGGDVGPDLRVSAQKLHSGWVKGFLSAPRAAGKLYPWRVYRMPDLGLTKEEVDVMTKYLATIGKRPDQPPKLPEAAAFATDKLNEGKLTYMLRCTECHNLGTVIPIPPVKQQGPDLIGVAQRIDFEWAKTWILDPKKIDPKTKMIVPGITPEQVDAVRMFIWKASMENAAAPSATASGGQ